MLKELHRSKHNRRHRINETITVKPSKSKSDDRSEAKNKKGIFIAKAMYLFSRFRWLLCFLCAVVGAMLFFVLKEKRTAAHYPLDFIVAGFPKAGTTTLLYAFNRHPQVGMDHRESSMIASVTRTPTHVYNVLQQDLERIQKGNINDATIVAHGIKAPTALYGPHAMLRLAEWYPEVKWIIGLRHPLLQVQSYYNYRVTEGYDKYRALPFWRRIWRPYFRRLEDMWFSNTPWKDISRFSHRYEFFLSMFVGRKPSWVTNEMESVFQVYPKWKQASLTTPPAVPASRVFLYTTDQLSDASLRKALQEFLGLTSPFLDELGHENKNRFSQGAHAHAESIDLCDTSSTTLRQLILKDAEITAEWIEQELLPHVTVSSKDLFVGSLDSWKRNPCDPATSQ